MKLADGLVMVGGAVFLALAALILWSDLRAVFLWWVAGGAAYPASVAKIAIAGFIGAGLITGGLKLWRWSATHPTRE